VNFISPSRIIQITIADAINLVFGTLLTPKEISLEVGYPKYEAHYTSSIALAIANRLNLSPFQIAEAIALTCSQNPATTSQWLIQALGKGWLNIILSEQYIAESLLALEQWQIKGITNYEGFWQKSDISIDFTNKLLDPIVQYAYARCCALIRLAKLSSPRHQKSGSDFMAQSLHLEPAEIGLLMQNLAIAAYLESENSASSNKSRTKLSRSLAESFLQFYDHCRIFGVNREVALRRLLLIRITQKLLLAIAPSEINYSMYL
jgi:arginyl-tRNA synthetase